MFPHADSDNELSIPLNSVSPEQTYKVDTFPKLKGAVPTPLVALSKNIEHTQELKAALSKRMSTEIISSDSDNVSKVKHNCNSLQSSSSIQPQSFNKTATSVANSGASLTSGSSSTFYNNAVVPKGYHSASSITSHNNPTTFTESISPISVSNISCSNLSEDMVIPPPTMFSDAVMSALQAVVSELGSNSNSMIKFNNLASDYQSEKSLQIEPLIAQISTLNIDQVLTVHSDAYFEQYCLNFDDHDEWSSPFVEEVLAKQPHMKAVPKKSALKKSSISIEENGESGVEKGASNGHVLKFNQNDSQSNIVNG